MLAILSSIAAICAATVSAIRTENDVTPKDAHNATDAVECCCQQRRNPSSLTGCDYQGTFIVNRGTKLQCCRRMNVDLCKQRPYHRTPFVDSEVWAVAERSDQCKVGFHIHGLGDESYNYEVTDGMSKEARLAEDKCCCTSMGVSDCEPGDFLVSFGGSTQCCGYNERSQCRDGDWFHHVLAKAGVISKFATTKTSKCEPGEHVLREVQGEEEIMSVNPFEVKAYSSAGRWVPLSMKTYHRAAAVRVRPGNFRVAKGETLTLSLEAERFGQIGPSAKVEASTNEALQDSTLEIVFGDEHIHKEFYIKFTMVRGASAPVVLEHKVYVSGYQECGVGFFDDRPRNCKKGFAAKTGFLTHDVPNYGLGIEYELVGIPRKIKHKPVNELEGEESPSESESTEEEDLEASMLETNSFEAMNATQRVTGLPCTGQCAKLKKCLWQKAEGLVEKWGIEVDTTVGTLTPDETRVTLQHQGVPFEIVSPPVVGMDGVKSATDVLQAISDMGAQAPLSAGLHVHVNMRSKKVGADITCSMKEIFAVWMSWIRYQNVIDEMQTPSRIGNDFARSLDITGNTLDTVRLNALFAVFRRGHEVIMKMPEEKDEDMTNFQVCEAMIGKKTYPFCMGNFRLPHDWWVQQNPEKFLQLNLTPLGRFGTFEFRSGTASLDPERVGRWIQFIVAFVDTFKDLRTTAQFSDDTVTADWKQLQEAQKAATPDELKAKLKGKVEDDFFEYFSSTRPFEESEVASPQRVGCVFIK